MEQELKKLRKPRKKKKMNVILKRLNMPSEQAIRDFNIVFYDIVLNIMEKEFGHR